MDEYILNDLLPLYEVREVTLEEAMILLRSAQKRPVESLVARAGERLPQTEAHLCQRGFASSILEADALGTCRI